MHSSTRFILPLALGGLAVAANGCGSDSKNGPASSGGSPALSGGSTGLVTGSGGAQLGSGGSTTTSTGGSGGASASGGGAPGGSSSGGSSSGGASGALNSTGGSAVGNSNGGNAGAEATGGSAAAGANAGGASSALRGRAAKICEGGKVYGDPLSGMGSLMQVGPPQSDYFAFIEGPVWVDKVSALFFSDNASSPTERIFKLVPPATSPSVFLPASNSNGLGVGNNDEIVATDQRNKAIVRFDATSGATIGKPISTGSAKPNDVVVRSDENMYFSDPDSGFYRVSPGGEVSAAMKLTQGSRPNGLALSLDENVLYIGDVGNKSITQYALAADGSVDSATPTPLVSAAKNDIVDGLCVDCAGNVYASTINGVEVYSSSGAYLGSIPTGEASNCTFGGSDHKTLYVTSRALLKYVALNVPGLPD